MITVPSDSGVLRMVVITGAPGVGKTEVARRLAGRYRLPSAVVDTDWLADTRPWRADERLYRLIAANLTACLPGYRAWGVRTLVVSGVLMPGRALDHLAHLIADPDLDWTFYGLRAGRAELAARARNDPKAQDAAIRISWSHLDDEVAHVPGVRLLDTTGLTVGEVVEVLAGWEAERSAPVEDQELGSRR
jgi:hypothetical protein